MAEKRPKKAEKKVLIFFVNSEKISTFVMPQERVESAHRR